MLWSGVGKHLMIGVRAIYDFPVHIDVSVMIAIFHNEAEVD